MEYTEEHKSSRKEISSLHFEALSWGKHFIPKPELRTTAYCFLPMGPGIDFPLIMHYTDRDTGNRQRLRKRRLKPAATSYFLNGHGDVTYFADANFTPEKVETYEYTPWGILLTSASKNNLLYTAREFDFETGLQFNRNRYYSLILGIFISRDPIKHTARNKYCYSCNNPVILKDPYGTLPPWLWPFFIVAILLESSCGGGGEGAYCGYISVTSTDKKCTIEKNCKEDYSCEKTGKEDAVGNTICECKSIK